MLDSNFSCIVLFLLSAFVCETHSYDYGDLEAMGIACPRSTASCVGYMNNTKYKHRSCECDPACNVFNDCCIDAEHRRPNNQARQRTSMTCLLHGYEYRAPCGERTDLAAYMIVNCSHSWHGSSEIREGCEGPENLSDPLNAAPVTSVAHRVTYRNRFCAECNNALLETLKTFQLKLKCRTWPTSLSDQQIMDDLEYNKQLGTWGISRLNSFGNATDVFDCEISFNIPAYFNNSVRFCHPNLISSCPSDWRRRRITRLCEEYMAVMYSVDRAYRNAHCAICNGRGFDEIFCRDELSICVRRSPVAVLLLDVNQSDGDSVGTTQLTTPECLANHTYDPFLKKCRRLVCPLQGHTVVEGKCIKE